LELNLGCFRQEGEGLKKWLSKKIFLIYLKKIEKVGEKAGLLMLNRRLGWQITNLAKRVFLMAPLPGFS